MASILNFNLPTLVQGILQVISLYDVEPPVQFSNNVTLSNSFKSPDDPTYQRDTSVASAGFQHSSDFFTGPIPAVGPSNIVLPYTSYVTALPSEVYGTPPFNSSGKSLDNYTVLQINTGLVNLEPGFNRIRVDYSYLNNGIYSTGYTYFDVPFYEGWNVTARELNNITGYVIGYDRLVEKQVSSFDTEANFFSKHALWKGLSVSGRLQTSSPITNTQSGSAAYNAKSLPTTNDCQFCFPPTNFDIDSKGFGYELITLSNTVGLSGLVWLDGNGNPYSVSYIPGSPNTYTDYAVLNSASVSASIAGQPSVTNYIAWVVTIPGTNGNTSYVVPSENYSFIVGDSTYGTPISGYGIINVSPLAAGTTITTGQNTGKTLAQAITSANNSYSNISQSSTVGCVVPTIVGTGINLWDVTNIQQYNFNGKTAMPYPVAKNFLNSCIVQGWDGGKGTLLAMQNTDNSITFLWYDTNFDSGSDKFYYEFIFNLLNAPSNAQLDASLSNIGTNPYTIVGWNVTTNNGSPSYILNSALQVGQVDEAMQNEQKQANLLNSVQHDTITVNGKTVARILFSPQGFVSNSTIFNLYGVQHYDQNTTHVYHGATWGTELLVATVAAGAVAANAAGITAGVISAETAAIAAAGGSITLAGGVLGSVEEGLVSAVPVLAPILVGAVVVEAVLSLFNHSNGSIEHSRYYYDINASNTCNLLGLYSYTKEIAVQPPPVIDVVNSTQNICLGNTVTINGFGFYPATSVFISTSGTPNNSISTGPDTAARAIPLEGSSNSTQILNANITFNKITFTYPDNLNLPVNQKVEITVQNDISLAADYYQAYVQGYPNIVSINNQGVSNGYINVANGSDIVINGTGFGVYNASTCSVSFSGTTLSVAPTAWTDTQIICQVPNENVQGPLIVNTACGYPSNVASLNVVIDTFVITGLPITPIYAGGPPIQFRAWLNYISSSNGSTQNSEVTQEVEWVISSPYGSDSNYGTFINGSNTIIGINENQFLNKGGLYFLPNYDSTLGHNKVTITAMYTDPNNSDSFSSSVTFTYLGPKDISSSLSIVPASGALGIPVTGSSTYPLHALFQDSWLPQNAPLIGATNPDGSGDVTALVTWHTSASNTTISSNGVLTVLPGAPSGNNTISATYTWTEPSGYSFSRSASATVNLGSTQGDTITLNNYNPIVYVGNPNNYFVSNFNNNFITSFKSNNLVSSGQGGIINVSEYLNSSNGTISNATTTWSLSAYIDGSWINIGNGNPSYGTLVYNELDSINFDGNSYLTWPSGTSVAFGTNNFTVEAWAYLTSPQGNQYIIDARDNSHTSLGNWAFGWGLGKPIGRLQWYNGNTEIVSDASFTDFPVNTWHHVAYVRNNNIGSLYVDGILVGSTTDTTNYLPSTTGTIGNRYSADIPNFMTGNISNLRVVNGTAVYTSNFTPPTSPLTNISGTTLLLNTLASNPFVDSSSNTFSITKHGDSIGVIPKSVSYIPPNTLPIGQTLVYTNTNSATGLNYSLSTPVVSIGAIFDYTYESTNYSLETSTNIFLQYQNAQFYVLQPPSSPLLIPATQQFDAYFNVPALTNNNSLNQNLQPINEFTQWYVNGILGGNSIYGTIDNGLYTTPFIVPGASTFNILASSSINGITYSQSFPITLSALEVSEPMHINASTQINVYLGDGRWGYVPQGSSCLAYLNDYVYVQFQEKIDSQTKIPDASYLPIQQLTMLTKNATDENIGSIIYDSAINNVQSDGSILTTRTVVLGIVDPSDGAFHTMWDINNLIPKIDHDTHFMLSHNSKKSASIVGQINGISGNIFNELNGISGNSNILLIGNCYYDKAKNEFRILDSINVLGIKSDNSYGIIGTINKQKIKVKENQYLYINSDFQLKVGNLNNIINDKESNSIIVGTVLNDFHTTWKSLNGLDSSVISNNDKNWMRIGPLLVQWGQTKIIKVNKKESIITERIKFQEEYTKSCIVMAEPIYTKGALPDCYINESNIKDFSIKVYNPNNSEVKSRISWIAIGI